MTLNHESLIAAAQSMEQNGIAPITFQINIQEDGDETSTEIKTSGENYPVLPGAVGVFEAQVFVNGKKKTVIDSKWILNGTTIDLENAVQSPVLSKVPTKNGPTTKFGGKNGLGPAKIKAAWVGAPGVLPITITGNYKKGLTPKPFVINGSVTLLPAPVTAGDAMLIGRVGAYDHYVPNTSIGQILGYDISKKPDVGFQWELHTGEDLIGNSGFVQFVRVRDIRRTASFNENERLGNEIYEQQILDSDGSYMFYPNASSERPNHAVKINSVPYVEMASYIQRDGKLIQFVAFDCEESYRTYLAYQAINQPVAIAAFVVGASYQDWSWRGQGNRNNLSDPYYGSGVGWTEKVHNDVKWMPLEWSSYIGDPKYQQWKSI